MDVKPFNVDILQRSVLEANDSLPNPGSHRWYIYERYRLDFVSLVKDIYCRDCQIIPDQFPYREDTVLALLSGYWTTSKQEKLEIRHRLGMKVPPVVDVDPDHSLSVLEFGDHFCDDLLDTTVTSHDFTIKDEPSEESQSGDPGQDLTDLFFDFDSEPDLSD